MVALQSYGRNETRLDGRRGIVRRNGGRAARGLLLDWRALPPQLPRFDVIAASDVLYERPYGALVARVLDATLRDGGQAIIADPGRVAREEFIRALGPLGLSVTGRSDVQFREEQIRQTIRLLEIGRRNERLSS